MNSSLKIYKASAGSGKTFTLTAEYLKLLFENTDDPYAFRKILAVTFTNKATAEMKQRILSELYKISIGDKGGVYDLVKSSTSLTENEISRKARQILKNILEDYSAFKVQTIDSFFQEIVRSFAMEMNRQSAFGIEMDSENVITLSLESLIERLDGQSPNIASLRKWISKVYQENLENESHTSTFEDIKRLASALLFSESNSPILKDITEITADKIDEAKRGLKVIIEEALRSFTDACSDIVAFFAHHGINPQDSYRKYLSKFGELLTEDGEVAKTFLEDEKKGFNASIIAIGYEDGPLYAKSVNASVKALFDSNELAIREKVKNVLETYKQNKQDVITSQLLLKYINAIPGMIELIHDIEEYRIEHNCLIISDINQLLNTIINDSELPFVYEKVGTRIKHYMIDEFQDTSPLQWANFNPLLRESLDNGNRNLLVGDVKQSIYRFRGTDSSLLGYKINREFDGFISESNLEYNWRSQKNIVDFNNAFFDKTYDFERFYQEQYGQEITEKTDDIQAHEHSYIDATQKLPDGREERGYITITQIEGKEINLEDIAGSIEAKLIQLQKEQGYSPSDIAFLVRNRAEGMLIAGLLSKLEEMYADDDKLSFNFLSDDALLINNSIIVRFLMCLIRCFAYPGREEYEKELALHIERYVRMYGRYLKEINVDALSQRLLKIISYGLTVYEAVSKAVEIIGYIPQEDETYVSSFLDIIFSFSSQKIGSYGLFVEWWEEHKDSAMINMGESRTNSITITTIHKSKGLEYPVVMLPFASWQITRKSLASPRIITADQLPRKFGFLPFYIIPTSYSKFAQSYLADIAETQFETDYTDTLNLLYVAFTRASEELHVYTHTNTKNNSADIILNRLDVINQHLMIDIEEDPDTGVIISHYGDPTHKNATKITSQQHDQQRVLKGITATPRYEDLLLSRRGYALSFEAEADRRKGIILHEIMSRTTTLDDFTHHIDKEVTLGRLTEEDRENYTEKLKEALKHPIIGTWFNRAHSTDALTEQDILTKEGLYRPDKVLIKDGKAVVIDYKFGAHNDGKYRKQVRQYLNLLEKMGYESPTGYIWYNLDNDIDTVTLKQ